MFGVVNPFSEAFLAHWGTWKQYKVEEFGFKYKGVISEQTALMQLSVISGGREEIAVEIINQSMSNGWKGLFPLKNNTNGTTKEQFRKDVSAEFAGRNYANGSH